MVVDSSGAIITVGSFQGTHDFDPTEGVDERTSFSANDSDVFITKLTGDGDYLWTRTLGGVEGDAGKGVTLDADGVIYIGGAFEGTVDFDTGKGVDERTAVGGFDAFVLSLAPNGEYLDTIVFATGPDTGSAGDIDRDAYGNIFVVGFFWGPTDFDPTEGVDERDGVADIFVTRINADGSYGWTHTIGGPAFDSGTGVAVDPDGNVLITGTFRGLVDFDPTEGVDQHATSVVDSAFVSKYAPDGTYLWTRSFQAKPTQSRDIAVDANGAVALSVSFTNIVDLDPTTGTDYFMSRGETSDRAVTKLNADGTYAWTRVAGGEGTVGAYNLAFDANGDVLLTGLFRETIDFDPTEGVDERFTPREEGNDAYIWRLTSDGDYIHTRTISGVLADGRRIAIDDDGAVILSGSFIPELPLGLGCEMNWFPRDHYSYTMKLVCLEPRADFDENDVVDLTDAAAMLTCLSGPAPATCHGACRTFDFQADDDIDLSDYALFAPALDGP